MKKSYLIGAGVLVVIIIAAFFMFSGGDDSSTNSENLGVESGDASAGDSAGLEGDVIDCGKISFEESAAIQSFATLSEFYAEYPEIKEKYDCISNKMQDCESAKITFGIAQGDGVLSIRPEGSLCVTKYEAINKVAECDYTKEQYKMLYESSRKQVDGGESLIGYGIALGMGITIMSNNEIEIVDSKNLETGKIVKVECRISGENIKISEPRN